ncbi:hypothetical protein [Treponema brennaborense]|uniref:Lipoprotein n=1 Tax=Treponema brennaborense (strain DSM 12168 / CIP 105900 / DD5/3) TaxID=906968 RepID=F4LNF2_TREBD|nr:hypothetical protein [Treponema brennaborense]AEE17910.1 hypothetical protein Trebr_2504 [Treponema brennaborense DSM 12168]
MKIKQGIIFPFLGMLIFIFLSCMTIKQYGIETTAFETELSGNIKEFKKSDDVDSRDIILSGKTDFRFGFDPLYLNTVDLMKWTGKVFLNDALYNININYRKMTENNRILNIRAIDIQNLPPIYKFEKFDISGSQAIWEKEVHESELPVKLASFSVEGVEFSVLLTSMNTVSTMKDSMSSFIQMITLKEQVFQIVDRNGTVYAEFSYDSYKIFSVPDSKIDEKLLWPCIAVFSTLRNIVLNI